ncbi:hypothetical protein NA78x_004889 [Anatilimnocola sp. NA78]|uniref:hypothetical protein n=1 Tax=Anatilimnocola sp. NA78 TaxID=3415683 RepID=UPI003CE52C88
MATEPVIGSLRDPALLTPFDQSQVEGKAISGFVVDGQRHYSNFAPTLPTYSPFQASTDDKSAVVRLKDFGIRNIAPQDVPFAHRVVNDLSARIALAAVGLQTPTHPNQLLGKNRLSSGHDGIIGQQQFSKDNCLINLGRERFSKCVVDVFDP